MNGNLGKISVTPVGRAVAQSVLHPSSAHNLIEFSAAQANELLALSQDQDAEQTFRFTLLHAAYSSGEYNIGGNAKNIPYQLDNLVQNALADASDPYLIERPWKRYPPGANAAIVALRWSNGLLRNELAPEFPPIGSGSLQNMIREGAEILFAWSDCLIGATARRGIDEDRPVRIRDNADLLAALRHLAAVIRSHARTVTAGLPGDVAWMGSLMIEGTRQPVLSRAAILRLLDQGLTDPVELQRSDKFREIVNALRPLGLPNLNDLAQQLRSAVRIYRHERRNQLWESAIERAPGQVATILQETVDARGKTFEEKVEALLDSVGIAYARLDDGKTPGAADLHIGLNHTVQLVVELKTADGDGTVGLNQATDVVKGAAIVKLKNLPKVTLANPGFDPNVPWQSRNVEDLALVEACQFGYGISLLARNEIDKDTLLDWLSQPGLLSIGQLRSSQYSFDQ